MKGERGPVPLQGPRPRAACVSSALRRGCYLIACQRNKESWRRLKGNNLQWQRRGPSLLAQEAVPSADPGRENSFALRARRFSEAEISFAQRQGRRWGLTEGPPDGRGPSATASTSSCVMASPAFCPLPLPPPAEVGARGPELQGACSSRSWKRGVVGNVGAPAPAAGSCSRVPRATGGSVPRPRDTRRSAAGRAEARPWRMPGAAEGRLGWRRLLDHRDGRGSAVPSAAAWLGLSALWQRGSFPEGRGQQPQRYDRIYWDSTAVTARLSSALSRCCSVRSRSYLLQPCLCQQVAISHRRPAQAPHLTAFNLTALELQFKRGLIRQTLRNITMFSTFFLFSKAVFQSLQLPLYPESAVSFCKHCLFPFY